MNKLEVRGLTKRFGDEVAVDDFSLSIGEGVLKSLLGPSGCGKTTTLRCIAGLETPDEGEIYIDEELVSAPEQGINVRPERRGIGMVFQNYAIWPHMTVDENVRFPLNQMKIGSKAERSELVDEILELVGLGDHADDLAPNLSGGQQQRVALARALVAEPELLLLDEPLSNLDAKLREDMRHEIRRICEELGVTMLYVTHSQDEALFLSDEIAIMNDGHLVEEGRPDEIHLNPKSFFGMNFLGKSNVIPGVVDSFDGDEAVVRTEVGDLDVTLVDPVEVGNQVNTCFRPKQATLTADRATAGDRNVIEGTLDFFSTTTDFYEYYVTAGNLTLEVRSPSKFDVQEDGQVYISIDAEHVKCFDESRALAGESFREGVSATRSVES